ncbi:DUF418 domain-containing protein [Winogradskyella sediminis]|uniref:Uncharacterized membrane protein YeiB n=1 Tax=Winogradskyella sediminis TaxID=1382466 RepID=A0A1H1X646_9FLAO|nr:DUF418 domain-containing protein [Winogradskyella sediminis]SDT04797.1 Uncharacterized membrane protein YeiB [Winogradskyella sediminis]
MKERIIGIDIARALAVIGMIIVNFKVVLGANGLSWVKSFASAFDGKAAATFVVLADIGLALMTNSALRNNNSQKLKTARIRIVKRALFLFIVGLSYIVIWPADILHFYGIYMLVVLLLLTSNEKTILILAIALILLYPLLIGFWNYETAWDFDTLDYLDFWAFNGFFRNLFFNGFHPVIPWTAFMLFGFWFGKQDLKSDRFIKKAFWVSSIAFVVIQILSHLSISFLSEGNEQTANELSEIIGTNPMPPLPFYMFNGIAISISIISACIIIGKRFSTNKILLALNKTGQLALTFYVAHVIIGMRIIEVINPEKMGNYPIEFSVAYALIFSILCVFFAVYWLKKRKNGPIEWIMKKIIG